MLLLISLDVSQLESSKLLILVFFNHFVEIFLSILTTCCYYDYSPRLLCLSYISCFMFLDNRSNTHLCYLKERVIWVIYLVCCLWNGRRSLRQLE